MVEMQGRYFLPLYILLPIFLHSDRLERKLNTEKYGPGIKAATIQEILIVMLVILNFGIIFCKYTGMN